jgi:hypothetical protein
MHVKIRHLTLCLEVLLDESIFLSDYRHDGLAHFDLAVECFQSELVDPVDD